MCCVDPSFQATEMKHMQAIRKHFVSVFNSAHPQEKPLTVDSALTLYPQQTCTSTLKPFISSFTNLSKTCKKVPTSFVDWIKNFLTYQSTDPDFTQTFTPKGSTASNSDLTVSLYKRDYLNPGLIPHDNYCKYYTFLFS